ncbi:MAG: glutathione S-transferase C-terminal domain-containing protein [Myxococcota bacterium]
MTRTPEQTDLGVTPGRELCHVAQTDFHAALGDEAHPVEPDRYWLFTSKLCPFAHRTEIVRALKGIQDQVGLTIAGPVQTRAGWNLADRHRSDDSAPSPLEGARHLPEVYAHAAPGYEGRASVPVLFDTRTGAIVNNESAEIIRQFDRAFTSADSEALYPEEAQREIDDLSDFLEEALIAPIYRAGFAGDQATYRANHDSVFLALDALEERLEAAGPYLLGSRVTLADVHAFPHLARFDAAYHSLYRLNTRFVRDHPALSGYMARLGEIPAFADTLDIEALKAGYFLSWNQPTVGTFVPAGPPVDPRSGVALHPTRRDHETARSGGR